MDKKQQVLLTHGDSIDKVADNYKVVATSKSGIGKDIELHVYFRISTLAYFNPKNIVVDNWQFSHLYVNQVFSADTRVSKVVADHDDLLTHSRYV